MSLAPRRVVVINDRSTPVGGASNLAQLSVGLLQKRGIEVVYVAGDDVAESRLDCETIGLAQRPLIGRSQSSAFLAGLYNADAYRLLSRLVHDLDGASTIYHVHGWSKILSPAIFRALRPVRERVVLHAHDYFLACPNGGFVNFPQRSVCALNPMSIGCLASQCDKRGHAQKFWRVARHALRNAMFSLGAPANLIAVHKGMIDYFAKAGVDTSLLTVIPNPVAPFVDTPCRPETNASFFFIGRLEPEKGFQDAAEAARRAGVRLEVIGDGAGRAMLRQNYPDVVLHGWRTKQEIAALIGNARAVVISSRVPEPFSLAALEAAGSGIPVIMPDAALIAGDLRRAGACLTYRSGDVDALAGAMRELAGSDALTAAMGRSAAVAAERLAHTAESWGSALVDCYARILERNAAAASSWVENAHTAQMRQSA